MQWTASLVGMRQVDLFQIFLTETDQSIVVETFEKFVSSAVNRLPTKGDTQELVEKLK